jgi:hypothetical protein
MKEVAQEREAKKIQASIENKTPYKRQWNDNTSSKRHPATGDKLRVSLEPNLMII